MPVVNDATNRVLAKGVRLYGADPMDTQWRRLYGLKGVNAVNFERSGEVDATELWQGPSTLELPEEEEQFFVTQQFAGTKKIPPLEFSLNAVPKTMMNGPDPVANQITLLTLSDWFSHDKQIQWSLQTRTGYEYSFLAQIEKIPMTGEEGNLWNGVMTLMPNSWIIYRPVPDSYAPWGSCDPRWGPPGVSDTKKTWMAGNWSGNIDNVEFNTPATIQGG